MLEFLGMNEVKPGYANGMEFMGNTVEIRLHFFLASSNGGRIRVAEIILAPIVAKALYRMMGENIKAWEKDHGFITLPEDVDLLESLFQVKLRPSGAPPSTPEES